MWTTPENLILARARPVQQKGYATCSKGAVYKGRPANGEGGWFWNFGHFRTGGGGVVCESSDVRKFLKKSKFLNFSELFKVKTRNYNRSRFQYESIHRWLLQQPRRQQISLIKNRSLKQGSIVRCNRLKWLPPPPFHDSRGSHFSLGWNDSPGEMTEMTRLKWLPYTVLHCTCHVRLWSNPNLTLT